MPGWAGAAQIVAHMISELPFELVQPAEAAISTAKDSRVPLARQMKRASFAFQRAAMLHAGMFCANT